MMETYSFMKVNFYFYTAMTLVLIQNPNEMLYIHIVMQETAIVCGYIEQTILEARGGQ
jgi:hypothetical protein